MVEAYRRKRLEKRTAILSSAFGAAPWVLLVVSAFTNLSWDVVKLSFVIGIPLAILLPQLTK